MDIPHLQKDVPLAAYTTFRIGGPAKYFVVAENKKQIIQAIEWAKKQGIDFRILGGGSNILIDDEGFDGLVVKVKSQKLKVKSPNIYSEAGVLLAKIVAESVQAGLTGLEWAIGIPGTVGGAICGNAGAFGQYISENVESVAVYNNETIEEWSNEKCQFAYRDSIFSAYGRPAAGGKHQPLIILSVILKLARGDKQESKQIIQQRLNTRKEKIPPYASAGSIFKNVVKGGSKIPAGRLIEQCGLKGKQIGQAQISEKHANFIVNLGGAKAKDVKELIKICKKEVKNKFNIEIKEEIVSL